jgi:flotillin
MDLNNPMIIGAIIVVLLVFIPLLVSMLLRTVEAGTIRLVSWMGSDPRVYKGPGKSKEVPLFTTGTTIPSKAINIDLDIADQTADVGSDGKPRPIKVRVLASAIVSVGDSNEAIKTAANRFFAMPLPVQTSTLTDLLTSTGRRAINLLHHDELFNAKAPFMFDAAGNPTAPNLPVAQSSNVLAVASEEDDRLAIIIKSACSRELQDLGLVFNSLNIKEVQSEVADARRRQSAVEAKANADIVQADQERRSKEAQLGAEQAVNDKSRDLEQRRAENAAIVAQAEAKKQNSLRDLRQAELQATQITQATADAERLKIDRQAEATAEAIRLRTVAEAQADAIRQVNAAIAEGGDAYLALRQLEMLPQIAPVIANALANARLVNISSGDSKGGAAGGAADQITSVIQTVLAAQLVNTTLRTEPQAAQSHPPIPAPAPVAAPKSEQTPTPAPRPTPTRKETPVITIEPQAPPFQVPKS